MYITLGLFRFCELGYGDDIILCICYFLLFCFISHCVIIMLMLGMLRKGIWSNRYNIISIPYVFYDSICLLQNAIGCMHAHHSCHYVELVNIIQILTLYEVNTWKYWSLSCTYWPSLRGLYVHERGQYFTY